MTHETQTASTDLSLGASDSNPSNNLRDKTNLQVIHLHLVHRTTSPLSSLDSSAHLRTRTKSTKLIKDCMRQRTWYKAYH